MKTRTVISSITVVLAMLANGWVITVITFIYVLIRAIIYTM